MNKIEKLFYYLSIKCDDLGDYFYKLSDEFYNRRMYKQSCKWIEEDKKYSKNEN